MTAGTALGIRHLGRTLLDAVVNHWATADGPPLPERRYLAAGNPNEVAWDCEQLTVSLSGIGWGPALDASPVSPKGGSMAKAFSVRHAVFSVSLVRCISTPDSRGKGPAIDLLNGDGERFMHDCGLLSQALVTWGSDIAGRLPELVGATVQLGVVEPAGPQGKYVAAETSAIITAANLEP